MKKCKNRKGISLVEVLIYLALISVFTPMIMSAFVYGFESYRTNNNLIEQEKKVMSSIQKIRNDVSKCDVVSSSNTDRVELKFANGSTVTWKFEGNSLKKDTEVIVEGIDNAYSDFQIYNDKLIVKIKPKITSNLNMHENRNILNPIITEFSVKYKK